MDGSRATGAPQYNITETPDGWVLVVQNEHCSVMQVFASAAAAGNAVERVLEFFETMHGQRPGRSRVA